MNKIPAVFALLCVTGLPMAAQTKVLVAKSRVPSASWASITAVLRFRRLVMNKDACTSS
jgi:hypothetical protein